MYQYRGTALGDKSLDEVQIQINCSTRSAFPGRFYSEAREGHLYDGWWKITIIDPYGLKFGSHFYSDLQEVSGVRTEAPGS
jgi:hypothetical protein